MIKEMTEKLKNGQDLTPKEAERLYVAIKRRMNGEAPDPDLIGWFDAVYDALAEGRHGNFITATPSCHEKSDCNAHIVKIRSLLSPMERVSFAYMFNFNGKFGEEAGMDIDRNEDFVCVNCRRLGLLAQKLPNTKLFRVGEGMMDNYINDICEHGFSTDRTPLNAIESPDELADMKAEFLRKSGIPVLLAYEDCMYDDVPDSLSKDVGNFVVWAKDCDLVRRIAAFLPEDAIEMAKNSLYEKAVRLDIPDIFDDCFDEQIENER